jgi:hypothetical protein
LVRGALQGESLQDKPSPRTENCYKVEACPEGEVRRVPHNNSEALLNEQKKNVFYPLINSFTFSLLFNFEEKAFSSSR